MKTETGIVLQGGGALGAYEVGALQRLFESTGEIGSPAFDPAVVAGVSIGAINAAVVAAPKGGKPIESLLSMWDDFAIHPPCPMPREFERCASLYGNPAFYTLRWDYYNLPHWNSLYDVTPLRATLARHVDFELLKPGSPRRLIVTATNIRTGCIETFDSGNEQLTADHIIASGSLPPSFPPARIGTEYYWDGGVFDNTPMGAVIDAFTADAEFRQLIVVNLFPASGTLPANLLEVYDRVLEIVFSNKISGDVKLLERINDLLRTFAEIDRTLPEDSPARQTPGYRQMKQYTLVNRVIYIENRHDEPLSGASDFSARTIRERMKRGYEDAGAALKNFEARSAPAHA